jgi:predicted DNA-binding transcriptional regulator YafY
MSERLKYERFIWFHGRIKNNKYPNAMHLAERFEISSRTAQRDIEFMRSRLNAPLEYSVSKRGYYYSDDLYELPYMWFDEDSIMAFALAVRLASAVPDTEIKKKLCDFFEKIFHLHHGRRNLCIEEISEKISVKNIEYSRVNEKHFHCVVDALFREKPVLITYCSPHTRKETERTILPLHLIHYMGSWHIIAFCMLRRQLRDFALSRIRSISLSSETVKMPRKAASIREYVRRHFGIMQGGRTRNVCLEFSPSVSGWIKEQIWHPMQKTTIKKDGSLVLMFPVADFREIKRRILSHGKDVKVISPAELAQKVKDEIQKMADIY